jgi:nucleoside triphosphate diphosphatase
MTENVRKPIDDLLAVMAALRTPGSGCPWDLQQTFETIAPYTIEEAYEVADAIQRRDLADLKEELGDLLLQVVYHARMAEEQGAFAFDEVAQAITEKMIRRHPHVFGSEAERAAGAAPGFWERAKAAERAAKSDGSGADPRRRAASVLDDVPAALPALTRAVKLQNKAAKVGFDWPSLAPVFEKLKEELRELEEVLSANQRDRRKVEEEFGDLLFVVANVARHLKLDPEAAFLSANQKFVRRFHEIERRLAEQGRTPAQSTLEEMDQLWDEAKAAEKE